MVFVACGLNHKTAPLIVREQLTLSTSVEDERLSQLINLPEINEAVILSTCNRTEIYCDTNDPTCIMPWLQNVHQVAHEFIAPYFYIQEGPLAIRHSLRVASGLDSMMLGEPQILGQMKQAYQTACRIGAIGKHLRPIFQYVFKASKRVRHESGIGNNPISIAYAAVQLIRKHFSNYQSLNVLLIGSGETASLVAKYLHQQGVHHFMIASRTSENASRLAHTFSGQSLSISDIPHYLSKADVIISATACPLPFISKNMVEHSLNERNNQPMFFLDLAMPRDIEADVSELTKVHLYNIDDLQGMIDAGMNERRVAAQKAEQLIDSELDEYIRWHRSLRAKDIICDYRTQMQDLAQGELERALKNLKKGQCHYNVLTEFSQRLINKFSHSPTLGLRQAARDNREELFDLAHYLFNVTEASHEEIT